MQFNTAGSLSLVRNPLQRPIIINLQKVGINLQNKLHNSYIGCSPDRCCRPKCKKRPSNARLTTCCHCASRCTHSELLYSLVLTFISNYRKCPFAECSFLPFDPCDTSVPKGVTLQYILYSDLRPRSR